MIDKANNLTDRPTPDPDFHLIRPWAAVCAISTLKAKNVFLAYFTLAAAKAKRRYPLLDPFQDSDEGKSGEYSDVAIRKPKSISLRIGSSSRWHARRIMRMTSNYEFHSAQSFCVLTYCPMEYS